MQPPEMIGRVILSSNEPRSRERRGQSQGTSTKATTKKHRPKASATPLTNPATMPTTPSPIHPPVVPTTPNEFDEVPAELAPPCHAQLRPAVPLRSGATHPQKPTAISVPVTVAAMNPAIDLRGASGRRRKGRREGRRGVLAPKRRPMVDAAVSAQERLLKEYVSENQERHCRGRT
jgi:hypothetical protein